MLQALSVFHCVNDGSVALFTSALPVMRLSLGLVVSSLAAYIMGHLASVMSITVALPVMFVIAVLGTAASLML